MVALLTVRIVDVSSYLVHRRVQYQNRPVADLPSSTGTIRDRIRSILSEKVM